MEETKICPKCDIEKNVSEFHKNKHNKDGLNTWCKQCRSHKNKDYIIDDLNSDKKVCRMCKIEKDKSEFTKDKNKKDGLDNYCKECKPKVQANYYKNNPEKQSEYSHNTYINHTEEIKERTKDYYNNNKEKVMITNKQWQENNQEKVKEIKRNWKFNDLLRYSLTNCLSRAKKNNIPYDSKEDLYNHLKLTYNQMKCECCGKELVSGIGKGIKHASNNSPSIDRIIPELGYTVGNVAVICFRCNEVKHNATIEEHRKIADWMESKINNITNIDNNNQNIPLKEVQTA
jgi:hypothetical protein